MEPLEAHIQNGRLVPDATLDLPEGTEVELVAVDDGAINPADRARLIQLIEEGAEDFAAGEWVDGMDFANSMLARREAASR